MNKISLFVLMNILFICSVRSTNVLKLRLEARKNSLKVLEPKVVAVENHPNKKQSDLDHLPSPPPLPLPSSSSLSPSSSSSSETTPKPSPFPVPIMLMEKQSNPTNINTLDMVIGETKDKTDNKNDDVEQLIQMMGTKEDVSKNAEIVDKAQNSSKEEEEEEGNTKEEKEKKKRDGDDVEEKEQAAAESLVKGCRPVLPRSCPNGQPLADHNIPLVKNGCGTSLPSNSVLASLMGGVLNGKFNGCCDEHSSCYSHFRANKDRCDHQFFQCMLAQCNGWWCKTRSYGYYLAVSEGGCRSFEAKQKEFGCGGLQF